MNPFSLPVVDPKTNLAAINSDKWKQMFQTFFVDPARQPEFKTWYEGRKPNEVPDANTFTKDRNLAMFAFLSSFHSSAELEGMSWDMASLPTFKELPGAGAQSYPTYFSVASISEHKEEAQEIIKFLISDEYQLAASKQGNMTVLNNASIQQALGQEAKTKGKNLRSVFYNKMPAIPLKTLYDSKGENALNRSISSVVLGKTDINTYFRESEEAANKAIEQMKK